MGKKMQNRPLESTENFAPNPQDDKSLKRKIDESSVTANVDNQTAKLSRTVNNNLHTDIPHNATKENELEKNLNRNLTHLQEAGFNSLILKEDELKILSSLNCKDLQPIRPYTDRKDIPFGELMSLRLLEKDNQVFTIKFNKLISSDIINMPEPIKDQNYLYVVVLKDIQKTETDSNYILELRVLNNVKSGHPTLVRSKMDSMNRLIDGLSVVAAGEFYMKNGKCILSNDKSGHFNKSLHAKGIDASVMEKILDYFLKPFYASKNGFFVFKQPPTEENMEKLELQLKNELENRGFQEQVKTSVETSLSGKQAKEPSLAISIFAETSKVENSPTNVSPSVGEHVKSEGKRLSM